jgi:hypothetical protein
MPTIVHVEDRDRNGRKVTLSRRKGLLYLNDECARRTAEGLFGVCLSPLDEAGVPVVRRFGGALNVG